MQRMIEPKSHKNEFDSESSEDDMDEQPMYDYTNYFKQSNYYFLFDAEMKFSERKDFDIEKDLDCKEYTQMKQINRGKLREFLTRIEQEPQTEKTLGKEEENTDTDSQGFLTLKFTNSSPSKKSGISSLQSDNSQYKVKPHKRFADLNPAKLLTKDGEPNDLEMDRHFKFLLQHRNFGLLLTPEIIAHMSYFMSTLVLSHKHDTENPFENAHKYPAFAYQKVCPDIIQEQEEVSSSSDDGDLPQIQVEDEDDLIDLTPL